MSKFEYYPEKLNHIEKEILSYNGDKINFNIDFNTRYIEEALTKWKKYNKDELKFRISETSLIQFLGITSHLLQKDQNLIFSVENIKLFFLFGDYKTFDNFKINCMNQSPLENEEKLCEIVINSLIISIEQEKEKLEKVLPNNFQNSWIQFENDNSIFSRYSILNFLEKSLIFKINEWKGLKDENEILESQLIELNRSMENKSFHLNISEKDLENLYNALKMDFINTEVTSPKDFTNVLLKPWKDHSSIIFLYMDHYQTYIFWEWFCEKYNQYWTLKVIGESKLFKNTSAKNGFFTSDTISSTKKNGRDRTSDKKEEDQLLIKKLKSV